MTRAVRVALFLATAVALAGCATSGVPVTGSSKEDPSWNGWQSETAVSVANFAAKRVIAVAFNGMDPAQGKIDYTSSTRTTHKGASLLGWAWSENDGDSWKYGGWITPTDDWPIVWGDPAIVSSGNDQKYVFMSGLAVPKSKMPASGTIDGSLVPYIGGACISRSSDGGKTFSLYQCVHNNFEFYDGGNMASSTRGDIYAAYIATNSARYDIWHAKSENDQFTKLPDPFPNCRMAFHPRIRVGYPALSLGAPDVSLFVAGPIYECDPGVIGKDKGAFGQIIINRYHNGSWGTPRAIGLPSAVAPPVNLSDRKLRTGPQFSFDVGPASTDSNEQSMNDHIRMLYTRSDGNRLWVEGSFCPFDLSSGCKLAQEWGSTPGFYSYQGDQFSPNVRAFPGFLTIPPAWVGTFVTRDHDPSGNTLMIRRGTLAVLPNGTRFMIGWKFVKPRLVCGDKRGYWGDYDDLQFIGFVKDTTTARFLRTFSDSSAGCTQQWEFMSDAVHVSSATFP